MIGLPIGELIALFVVLVLPASFVLGTLALFSVFMAGAVVEPEDRRLIRP